MQAKLNPLMPKQTVLFILLNETSKNTVNALKESSRFCPQIVLYVVSLWLWLSARNIQKKVLKTRFKTAETRDSFIT
jgi:hypothetical protein